MIPHTRLLAKCLCVLLGLALGSSCLAASGTDINGYWVTPDGSALIEIYSLDGATAARINALREQEFTVADGRKRSTGKPRLDVYNPTPALRQRSLRGMVIASQLHFEDGRWRGGRIYDPSSGNSYRCEMELAAGGFLRVRGYLGISLFGRTMYWQRAADFEHRVTAMLDALPTSSSPPDPHTFHHK